jgi:uncharacterized protein YwqG
MFDEAAIRDVLLRHGLEDVAARILGTVRPGLNMRITPAAMDALALGQSRLGGQPDMPPGVAWPECEGVPLSFLAQINLAETAAFEAARELPDSGQLLFFYDAEQSRWGFDPADGKYFRVLHYAGDDLVRAPFPDGLDEDGRFKAGRVAYELSVFLPDRESLAWEQWKLTEEQDAAYDDVWWALANAADVGSKLLGHPDLIQGDMQEECALVTNGIYCGDPSNWKDARAAALKEDAPNWRLLLQIGSEEEVDMMWCDCGNLYFWIHERDLKAGALERCWLILQCS